MVNLLLSKYSVKNINFNMKRVRIKSDLPYIFTVY